MRHPIIIRRYGKPHQQRNVLGIAHNPSTRIAAGRLFSFGALLAVLLGTLLLVAATASAEPITPSTEATVPVSEPPQETSVPVSEPPSEATVPVSEPPSEATVPPGEPPAEASVPVSEPPSETTTPISDTPLETSSPVSETVAETVAPIKETPQAPIVEREAAAPGVPGVERVIEVSSPVGSTDA